MEFSDLNDQIGVDDWLIPSEEITRRRLIKQTPTHNIYKADWFGDVLVYEPISSERRRKKEKITILLEQEEELKRSSSFPITRPSSLNRGTSKSQLSLISNQSSDSSSVCDSAYSSISSTPQYHNSKHYKFEFPSPSVSSFGSSLSLYQSDEDELEAFSPPASPRMELNGGREEIEKANNGNLLNKSSFQCGGQQRDELKSSWSWRELNELRLVAHESFMLFMGASIQKLNEFEALQESNSTSLVMQMNHPKATSLYNLLHANKLATSSSSPIDRFFGFKQQPLNVEAKLNICQQVTNAMTYLHDKNIVHGKLTSVNIYVELNQRVKISLIDNSEVGLSLDSESETGVQFDLPSLTYLSPELTRTIRIVKTNKCDNELDSKEELQVCLDTRQFSKKSDIFSFGTLLFELFQERFPYSSPQVNNECTSSPTISPVGFAATTTTLNSKHWNGNITASASELIFQIGTGQMDSNLDLQREDKSDDLKLIDQIISACWSFDSRDRPQFKQLSFA